MLFSVTESDPQYLLISITILLDPRRLNVAMSRSKAKMVLAASKNVFNLFSTDEETFANAQLWKNLLRKTYTVKLWERERYGAGVEGWGMLLPRRVREAGLDRQWTNHSRWYGDWQQCTARRHCGEVLATCIAVGYRALARPRPYSCRLTPYRSPENTPSPSHIDVAVPLLDACLAVGVVGHNGRAHIIKPVDLLRREFNGYRSQVVGELVGIAYAQNH